MTAVYDLNLSHGAVRLYIMLDDMAAYRGTAWPSQETAAKRLGVTVRQVRRWYRELAGAYLSTIRNRRENAIQSLVWTGCLERTKMSGYVTKMSSQADKNVRSIPYYMNQEIEPGNLTCEKCSDTGVLGDCSTLCDCPIGADVAKERKSRYARRRA